MPEEEKTETVPMQTMPALALRGLTVYPKMMVHFDVGREASVKAIEESMSSNQPIFLVAQKDIRVEEAPIPAIEEDGILLKVKAAAICGTDVRMVNNGYKGISPETPRILGHELSGIIERVGRSGPASTS